MSRLDDSLGAELAELRARHLHRRTRAAAPAPCGRATLEGRAVIRLGSNDYLGLAGHPEVRRAAAEAAETWGAGSTGSRLTTGTLPIHEELEAALARLKGTEAALLFGSGYHTALGTVPALVGRGDLIVSDQLNHASLIDACRLSRAEVRVFRHNGPDHARELLRDRGCFRRALVLTEGVFSMDGDVAPLRELAELCEARDAWLMVDDAHGTGVLGPGGAGTAAHLGVRSVPIQMGTLSKTLGAEGGFIAGSRVLIDFLRNRARTFVFSTAPAPPVVAAALRAVELLAEEPWRQQRLADNGRRLRRGLAALGFDVPEGSTPIVPVIVGQADRALAFAERLEARGVWCPAIRPPTVPEGTARLRASVSADHSPEAIAAVLAAFAAVREELP